MAKPKWEVIWGFITGGCVDALQHLQAAPFHGKSASPDSDHRHRSPSKYGQCWVPLSLEVVAPGRTEPQGQGWATGRGSPEIRVSLIWEMTSLFSLSHPCLGFYLSRASDLHFKEKNAPEVVCGVLHHQVVRVEVCGVWNWMVFPTVVLITKLLMQDGCRLGQRVKETSTLPKCTRR